MKRFLYITVLSVFSTVSFARGGKHFSIPESVFDSIYHEVKTPYEYGYFLTGGLTDLFPPTNVPLGERLSSDPGIVGNPIVFRIPGDRKYVYMSFTYHDGIGYQTGLARSRDFVSWEAVGVMIDNTSYNHTSNWDKYHAGGYIMRDHVWGKTPYPHRAVVDGPYKGLYSMTYLGSNEPYNENGNVSQGIAFSDRIFEKDGSVAKWWRYENPILSPDEGYAYEAGACWKSEAIWDEKNNRYAIFYNASRKIPECLCQAYSKDLIHWEREPSNPVIGPEEHEGYLWGKSHSGDPDVVKIGNYWVIFYFSTTPNGIVDVFAVSTDMVHWQQSFRPLLTCNSTWSNTYAHKPCVIKQNGVVYHYYVAYGNIGYISAVNTSIDLSILKTALAIPEGKYPQRQYKAIQKAIGKLQNSLIEENGSLESIEKAIKNLVTTQVP
ncbi:MAG: hypothetical protein LBL07_02125 [Tannerella sp.]|nr:hypothetical protein [Tannerella sp.]